MTKQYKQKNFHPDRDTFIHWCPDCNLPLLNIKCTLCHSTGERIDLGPPGDVRFCSPYERSILHDILTHSYGNDPLNERIILLNKIGGEDKTDQVIVDGMMLGILRFDLKNLDWRLDLSMDGGTLIAQHTRSRTIELSDVKGHLNGKSVGSDMVHWCSDDISKGDDVIIRNGKMTGVGTALLDAADMGHAGVPAVRVRKIGKGRARLKMAVPTMDEVVSANAPAIKQLGRNAMNTIKGLANQQEYRGRPVYVSFSGGKDSLVVLDLTRSALKHSPKAYFINTGLEFPETVKYARKFCSDNNIDLLELDAGDAFWMHLPNFGPPAKDYRWCCKVCKLSPAGRITEEGKYLTMDGKRRYESFSRARIPPKEENSLVPGQVNVYPIRDWRAIEVWLYIHWRGLEYNHLYDEGFERVGCWLCPAALGAEYQRMLELHPELFHRWDTYLRDWADSRGLPVGYVEHGFWRWREHPPKMRLLAEQLGIDVVQQDASIEAFRIFVVSGVSPCRAGGYSIEGSARGVTLPDVTDMMRMLGEVRYSEELGVLVVQTLEGSIKLYADGTFQVNGGDRGTTQGLFEMAARQLMKSVKCTGCRICEKACPNNAIRFENGHLKVGDGCNSCGVCDEVCVVTRYMGRIGDGESRTQDLNTT
ncbi:MAG: phosphoadenosine phosphosulfate reductase family protein [Methanosarcinales archaeon]|nr:phosphoadenosine phosphosulfate reductase family protein [Methanosarcinales archaeon]